MKWLLTALIFFALYVSPVFGENHSLAAEPENETTAPLIDRLHSNFKTRLDRYATYLDNFFVDERADEEAANTQIRLISSFDFEESKSLDFTPRIKARLNLPQLRHKANLLIDTESDDTSTLTDQEPGSQSTGRLREETSVAVQLVQKRTTDFGLSHRLGLGVRDGQLNPKVRSQARFTWQTSERDLLRFTQAIFWEEVEGFGEKSRFDYEHLLHQRAPHKSSLLRISLQGLFSEESDGYEWSLPIEILNALSNQRAYSYGGSLSGETGASSGITNTAIFFRYRQSIWRKWLFFDLTPRLEWPKIHRRNTTAMINFSFEILL